MDIKAIVDFILGLGPSIMLPIIMTFIGLILGQGISKSFRAALTIGIGFVGIGLVIGLLFSALAPATEAFVKSMGLKLDIMDVGWPIGAAISFGTPVAPLMILTGVVLNVILLATNFTKTMDVDIWNYWHFIFAASVTYYAFHSMILALVVGCVIMAITLKQADWTAPVIEHHFGLPGVSLPHQETVNFAPIMYALNKIEDRIPYFNKLNANPESLQKNFGLFGEPMMMGLILGALMAMLGKFDLKGILITAVQMSASLVLLPRMVSLLMEGLIPISEGARDFLSKRFPGKKVYIGLDAAIVIGHPANMAVALLMVPVAILMAVILPYNRMLPFADLAVLPFTVIWAVAASRGNIIRGIVNAIFALAIVFFLATSFADLATTMGQAVGFKFPEGATLISGIDLGSHIVPWIILHLLDFNNPGMMGLAGGCGVIYALMWYWVRNDIKKQYANEIGEQYTDELSKYSNNKTVKQ